MIGPWLAPPGSTLWLLGHDLRLAARDIRAAGAGRSLAVGIVLGTNFVVLHLLGFLAAPGLARLRDHHRADMLLAGSVALAGAFTLFLSKAITEATEALHQRGDLDLLLSSPLPMRRVLTTRLLAIAVVAAFLPILFIVPLVDGMVLRGEFAWIGAYPVLASLALTASSAGAAVTFGLLVLVGPRWTKFCARALATLFGALAFLSTQARMMVPEARRAAIWASLRPADGVPPHGAQWWPARAALGDALPMAGLLLLAMAAVAVTARGLGQVYGAGVMARVSRAPAGAAAGVARRFGGGLGPALLRKEWRLLVRHPGLAAQVVYQFVFLVPGAIALMRVGHGASARAASVVFLCAIMTGRMARLLAAGPFEADQAAALAATAPDAALAARRAKVAVVVGSLAVIGGLPLAAIAWRLPHALLAAAVSVCGAAATRLWLAIARPRPLRRPGMAGRVPTGSDGLLGALLDIGWGVFGVVVALVA